MDYKASVKDIMMMIEKMYEICEFFGVKDYELSPQEERDINLK